jgi:serine/threonine-protein kinase
MPELKAGDVVGSYRVEQRIGAGSMGEVWRAHDEALGRKVALKILGEPHRESDELRARFLREARAVAALNHPHVVQVFTVGEWEGRPWFAMEYLTGPDLGRLIRDRGPLPDGEAAATLLGAARGLREAARRGLIHRDVKPSNLVVTDGGEVKITDFGLAKGTDIGPGLTQSGIVVGTPDYIAPEQARGDAIDYRADIYALGCTLFHVVAGRPPYRDVSDSETRYMEVVMRHLRDPVPDLAQLAHGGCDAELAALAAHMMAKPPAGRPGYDDIIDVLAAVAARLRGSLTGMPPARSRRPASAAGTTRPPGRAAAVSREQPGSVGSAAPRVPGMPGWVWAVTVLAVVVALVGVGLRLLGGR